MKIIYQQYGALSLRIWRCRRIKKGNIIIVSLILCSLCLIMVFSIYRYKMQRLSYTRSALEKCIALRKDDAAEIIFTALKADINNKCIPLNSDTLKNYLLVMPSHNYSELKAEVSYSSTDSIIAIKEIGNNITLIKYYKVIYDANNVCFQFSHRKYIK